MQSDRCLQLAEGRDLFFKSSKVHELWTLLFFNFFFYFFCKFLLGLHVYFFAKTGKTNVAVSYVGSVCHSTNNIISCSIWIAIESVAYLDVT